MNQEIKKLWLEALRNGNYSQCSGVLRNNKNEFCCLGVLCDVHAKLNKAEWSYEAMGEYGGVSNGFTLPSMVQSWAGLTDEDPLLGENRASDWNDNRRKSFTEIADLVEKHL